MITYTAIILLSWATFLLVWIVSAFNIKPDVRGGYAKIWGQYWLMRIVGALVIVFFTISFFRGRAHFANLEGIFTHDIFTPSQFLGWTAAALAVIGVAFAIWARVYLGRNWSPRPAVKEHHELVISGPYQYVRHPIYTGVILMAFGMALTGSIYGISILIFASLIFIARINKEEKTMLELFPSQYSSYQARTKRLIPFVW